MRKRFCDMCGIDITNEEVFELGIYDALLEKDVLEKDMCEKCTKKIKKLIIEQENK